MRRAGLLRWQLEVLAVRHGLWVLPGLAMLACALAAWLVWLPGRQAALDQAVMTLADARRTPQVLAAPEAQPVALPPAAMAPDAIQRLFALARQHGLRVVQAEYRRQDSKGVGRWQVQMPATGTYPQVRYFLRAAQAIPGLSLDEIGLHRNAGGAPVEARLLFSVWYSGERQR